MKVAMTWVYRLSPLARSMTVALVGAVAGTTGAAGIAAQAFDAEPVTPAPKVATTPPPSIALAQPVAAAAVTVPDPGAGVRRAPVGPPSDYPESIAKAPRAALSGYQRAELVINAAADCDLDWEVLAAVARVESDHGRGLRRRARHRVTAKGRVLPALVATPLDGKQGRGLLRDTDDGKLDRDRIWDAPVGALGLVPSTWSSVAVDSDGDGRREPQDLDDAALGAAVFLCSQLAAADVREALASYHRAPRFVGTVMALAARYEKQSATMPPAYQVPPGGLPLPETMPDLCECTSADPDLAAGDAGDGSPFTPTPPGSPGLPTAPAPTGPTGPTGEPSSEPTVGVTEPTTGPTDPTTGPTEPTEPTEPTTEPTEPTTGPTEPTGSEPTAGSTDPTSTP